MYRMTLEEALQHVEVIERGLDGYEASIKALRSLRIYGVSEGLKELEDVRKGKTYAGMSVRAVQLRELERIRDALAFALGETKQDGR